jgi:hypothetical protein
MAEPFFGAEINEVMSNPLVSAIVPTKDSAATLEIKK